jgi:Na+-transporting methylmalonyl-CoA/oxaloacetate decarboxylase gamma subunit
MSVVFIGLILLYVAFKTVGNTSVKLSNRNAMKAHGITDRAEAKEKFEGTLSGEQYAAIAMAMHEYMNDVHDVEDMILTIQKVRRTYSPWSSKIYTLRETPRR